MKTKLITIGIVFILGLSLFGSIPASADSIGGMSIFGMASGSDFQNNNQSVSGNVTYTENGLDLEEGSTYTTQNIDLNQVNCYQTSFNCININSSDRTKYNMIYEYTNVSSPIYIQVYNASDDTLIKETTSGGNGISNLTFSTSADNIYLKIIAEDNQNGITGENSTVDTLRIDGSQIGIQSVSDIYSGDAVNTYEYDVKQNGNILQSGSSIAGTQGILFGVSEGSYEIVVNSSGYQTYNSFYTASTTDTNTKTYTLTPYEGTLQIDNVTDETGSSISSFDVTIKQNGSVVTELNSVSTTFTHQIETGTYEVTVDAENHNSQTKTVEITNETTTAKDFTLQSGTTSTGTISGNVTDTDTGNALDGTVLVEDLNSDFSTTVNISSDDGTYEVTGLSPSEYEVTAQVDGYETITKTATVSSGDNHVTDFALSPVSTATETATPTSTSTPTPTPTSTSTATPSDGTNSDDGDDGTGGTVPEKTSIEKIIDWIQENPQTLAIPIFLIVLMLILISKYIENRNQL